MSDHEREAPPQGGEARSTPGQGQSVPVTEASSTPRPIPVSDASAPEASAEAEERFRALAEHSRDSIVEIAADGKLLYVSPAFTEISGFEPGEVLGRNALELVHPDDLAEVDAIRSVAFTQESPAQLLFRSAHKDGSWRWIDLAGRPYRTSSGELRGVLVSRDVTDRVVAEHAHQEQLDAERLITDLARRLLTLEPHDFEAGLVEGLGVAGRLAGADRVQLYFVDPRGRGVGGYYQWNADGIPERDPGDFGAAASEYAWSSEQLLSGDVIHMESSGAWPPEAHAERAVLEREGVRSYLALPILRDGRSMGFLDFCRIRDERGWTSAEISRLTLVAEVLHNAVRGLRSERRRRDSEDRLRVLMQQAQDTICELSEDGRILYLSPNFEKLSGYTATDAGADSPWDFVHPADRATVRRQITEAVATGGQVPPVMYRIRHRDGSWRWLEATVRPFRTGAGERRLAVVVRDVSERQAGHLDLERRLELERRIAEFSRSLLEQSAEGVDASIQHGLELAGRLAGADRAYLVTSLASETGDATSYDWLAPGVAPRPLELGLDDRSRQRWVTEKLVAGEVVHVANVADLDGAARMVRASLLAQGLRSYLAVPILAEGRLTGVLGFHCLRQHRDWEAHDVTLLRLVADLFTGALRRKRAQTRLRESQVRLLQAQKMEAIGTLAGGIAHDFNNQLTVMLANARFAKAELADDSEALPALEDLTRAAEHCAQLTRSLLAFSRRAPGTPRGVDATEAVGRAQDLLRPLIPTSIRFAVEVDPGVGWIVADDTQLQQVLVNLVVNARDAMPAGGMLVLRVTAREVGAEDAAAIGLAEPGRYVEFLVRDTGVGMDAAVSARIFEPFFTTKPVGQGTGLGLATAYGIVQQCGGAISVESERGHGSTFRVYLPEAPDAAAVSTRERPSGAAPGSGTVLLAEDEESVRRATARMLEGGGYEVLCAADGAEALRLGRQNLGRLAALVTDVEMPRLDGVGLARRLLRQCPELPVVFISGTAPVGVAVDPAADDFLHARFVAKPFSDADLLDALHELQSEIVGG